MLEQIILGIIYEQDFAGYDIKKIIENSFGVYYKASFGSLYPALKRLSAKGLVYAYEEPQGGRKKIFYHITASGKNAFTEWLTTPMDVLDGTNPNITKIYFFHYLSHDKRKDMLLDFEEKNKLYLQKLQNLEMEFQQMEPNPDFYFKLSTLYYGISLTKKTIAWCKHIREQKPLPDFK